MSCNIRILAGKHINHFHSDKLRTLLLLRTSLMDILMPRPLSWTSHANWLHRRPIWTTSRTVRLIQENRATNSTHHFSHYLHHVFHVWDLLSVILWSMISLALRFHSAFWLQYSLWFCQLLTTSTMAASLDEENDPISNRYIPREARAVPDEEVVHTIEFRKITYPLTDRPAELWIVEANHRGHKHWRTLERFLDDFAINPLGAPPDYAMASCAHLETLALQWREYYNVPHPFPHGGPPQLQELRRHILPQQIDPNTTFEGPHASIPNQQPLLRACWGCSAFRHSQGNPALSLSVPLFPAGAPPTSHYDLGDLYKTYDFGPYIQTPMACPVSGSSDLFDEFTYTHWRISYIARARKKQFDSLFHSQYLPIRCFVSVWFRCHVNVSFSVTIPVPLSLHCILWLHIL